MLVKPTPLFFRSLVYTKENQEFLHTLQKVLNLKTLNKWTWKKTFKWLTATYEEEYVAYRFLVLKQWINQNEMYSSYFVNNLVEIISLLDLNKYLTAQEQNYINHYKSIVFAKNRNLKNLIVDFKTLANEEIWYHYDVQGFYQGVKNDEYLCLQTKSSIYLTSLRIIIAKGNEYFSIFYTDIKEVKISLNMLFIKWKADEFWLVSNDVEAIYVSIERVSKLIKIRM